MHPEPRRHSAMASPAAEVQDRVGGEHTDDDEGSGDGHWDVVGGVGQQHVLVHVGAERQEPTHP